MEERSVNISKVVAPSCISKYLKLMDDELIIDSILQEEFAKFIVSNFKDDELFYAYRSLLYFSTIRPNEIFKISQIWKIIFKETGISLSFNETSDVNLKLSKVLSLFGVFDEKEITKYFKNDLESYPILKFFGENTKYTTLESLYNDYEEDTVEYFLFSDDFSSFQEASSSFNFSIDEKVVLSQFSTNKNYKSHEVSMMSFAAYYGSIDCFKFILLNKAKITEDVPLWAVRGGNLEIIRLCAQNGYNLGNCILDAIAYYRNDVADWIMNSYKTETITMDTAMGYFNIRAALFFDKFKCDDYEFSNVPLQIACSQGAISLVKYLIERETDFDYGDSFDMSLMHCSARAGSYKIIEYLISRGDDIDAISLTIETPLHYACKNEYLNVANLLLENGANANALSLNCVSPLHLACSVSSLEICKLLVKYGANINAHTAEDETPLHIACEQNSIEIVKYLVSLGAEINCKTTRCMTPLHYACINRSSEIVSVLLSNGSLVNEKDSDGNTPLMTAEQLHFLDIVDILHSYGAK